jgi:hypothetical protein
MQMKDGLCTDDSNKRARTFTSVRVEAPFGPCGGQVLQFQQTGHREASRIFCRREAHKLRHRRRRRRGVGRLQSHWGGLQDSGGACQYHPAVAHGVARGGPGQITQ